MLNLIDIFNLLQFAVLAIVLHRLIQPGMIFGAWGTYLNRRVLPPWLRAPLGECFTCFSGQIGFWSGIGLEIYRQCTTEIIFAPDLPLWLDGVFRVIFHTTFVIYFSDILNFNGRRD